MKNPNYIRINGAIYLRKVPANPEHFVPICSTCECKNICEEPMKEHRVSCPSETYEKMHEHILNHIGKDDGNEKC